MGEAKRRKKLDPNYGKSKPKPKPQPMDLSFLSEEDEGSIYDDCPELLEYVNELKSANMTLEQFRERFGQELDIIEIKPQVHILSQEDGEVTDYRGKGLAVRYGGKSGPAEVFAFPDADNPDAPVPPDVFDYLASFWPC